MLIWFFAKYQSIINETTKTQETQATLSENSTFTAMYFIWLYAVQQTQQAFIKISVSAANATELPATVTPTTHQPTQPTGSGNPYFPTVNMLW